MPKKFQYGRSPNPTNWHEGADALRSVLQPTRKHGGRKRYEEGEKKPSLYDRVVDLENRLKEK